MVLGQLERAFKVLRSVPDCQVPGSRPWPATLRAL